MGDAGIQCVLAEFTHELVAPLEERCSLVAWCAVATWSRRVYTIEFEGRLSGLGTFDIRSRSLEESSKSGRVRPHFQDASSKATPGAPQYILPGPT